MLKQPMDGDARAKTVLSMFKTAIPKAMPHTTATFPITVDLDEDIADDVLNTTTTASDSKSAKEKNAHTPKASQASVVPPRTSAKKRSR